MGNLESPKKRDYLEELKEVIANAPEAEE